MNISQAGIDLIKSFEGCRLDAYDDLQPKVKITDKSQVKGTLTIGYGHTGDVHIGQVITQAQADALLLKDLQRYVDPVNKQLKVKVNQYQFDALVSFCYNCGPGAVKILTDKINRNDFDGAITSMMQYNKSRDKMTGQLMVLPGLARRREAERKLFVKPVPKPKKVLWDGKPLQKGQIGRLTIIKRINVYKRVGEKLVKVRFAEKGEVLPVFEYDTIFYKAAGQYRIEGNLWITNMPGFIKYETPSKRLLESVK
jgi:lysozyme